MRHMKRGRKLNRTSSHRKALLMNLASSLILHRRIQTTDAKAKELRKFVEPLVTFAKQGTVHSRRMVRKVLAGKQGEEMTAILFNEIAPLFADRPGGYTRIIKLGLRINDRAPVSLIEFVEGDCMQILPTLKPDSIFLDPPWGGTDYGKITEFKLSNFDPDGKSLLDLSFSMTNSVVMRLPKNFDLDELKRINGDYKLQENYLKGQFLHYCVYFR